MRAEELRQLYYLNREIEQDQKRLNEIETAAAGTTVSITGLPHIKYTSDKTALAADIADIKELIEAKKRLCIAEYKRLMRYISSLDDSFMRQLLTFRYVNGFTWVQVAMHIGGGNTDDSVRKAHKRFLEKEALSHLND